MHRIGPTRFIAVSADNAGNTRASRRGIVEIFSFLLNLQDPCHKLSLAIQGICALQAFKAVILIMRGVIKFFSESTESNNRLELARIELDIHRGIIHIGKTRFATLYHSGESLRRCIPAIRAIVCDPEQPVLLSVRQLCYYCLCRFNLHMFRLGPSISSLQQPQCNLSSTFSSCCRSLGPLRRPFCVSSQPILQSLTFTSCGYQ